MPWSKLLFFLFPVLPVCLGHSDGDSRSIYYEQLLLPTLGKQSLTNQTLEVHPVLKPLLRPLQGASFLPARSLQPDHCNRSLHQITRLTAAAPNIANLLTYWPICSVWTHSAMQLLDASLACLTLSKTGCSWQTMILSAPARCKQNTPPRPQASARAGTFATRDAHNLSLPFLQQDPFCFIPTHLGSLHHVDKAA